MNVVHKLPGQTAIVVAVRRSDSILGQLVGGMPVTCLKYVKDGVEIRVWCDDDGISKDLPVNFARPTDGAEIRGPVVVTGVTMTKEGPDWGGLSKAEVGEALDLMGALGVER